MTTRQPVKLSAVHQRHLALGANMTSQDGWQRPARYTSSEEEVERLLTGVGVCDISPVGKLLVEGTGIESLIGGLLCELPVPGCVQYQDFASSGSLVVDRPLLCRLADDQLLILTSSEARDGSVEALEQAGNGCLHLVDMTSALAGFCLAGPRSRDTLAKLTQLDLSTPNLTCAQASLALIHATLVRADNQAEPCFQIYVSTDLGEYAWDAIVEAGREFSIIPFGIDALRRLQEGGP